MNFWIVDTFSEKKFLGVPSSVFFVDTCDDEILLQNIAAEINVPETIFIRKRSDEVFDAVCFTAQKKGLFFGNALYAAAKVISETLHLYQFSIVCGIRSFLACVSQDGEIKIRFATNELEKVKLPVNLSSALNGELVVSLAECKEELIVEVRSPNRLFDLSPNMDMLARMEYNSFAITADTHYEIGLGYDFCTRVFAPKLGIWSDIISPIACAKLAKYWSSRIDKTQLIASCEKGQNVSIEIADEYTNIVGKCVISSIGEVLIP